MVIRHPTSHPMESMSLLSRATRLLPAAALAAAALLAAPAAHAQTTLTSGSWTYFEFGGVGSGATGQPFTYTSASAFYVTILDGYASGDLFELLVGSTVIGTSTTPTMNANCFDPAMCLADGGFSRGTFLLGAGSYDFNVGVLASPYGSGGAWLGVNVSQELAGTPALSTVPEPGTVVLTGAGLALLVGVARRRARAA